MSSSKHQHSFLYRNGLTLVMVALMVIFLFGQFYTGWREHNEERTDKGQTEISLGQYATTGHFVQATFENWESEFLQMFLYVLLTVWLRQKGSAESKKLKGESGEPEEVDRQPKPGKNAPWAVNKGGLWLKLYKNSLAITFALLFLISFVLHFCGSRKDYNEQQTEMGKPQATHAEYIVETRFWFESFQNWQSEFLSVACIVFFTVYLRQYGSPESKPVDAPHTETGR